MTTLNFKSLKPLIKQFQDSRHPGGNSADDAYRIWLNSVKVNIESIHVSEDGKIITVVYSPSAI